MREDISEYALERAAIMEFDGGFSRKEAEKRAREEVREKFRGEHADDRRTERIHCRLDTR